MPVSIDDSIMKRGIETMDIKKGEKTEQKDMRFYWKVDEKEPHPSVTTVMGFGTNSGKKMRINDWKQQYKDNPIRLRYHQSIGTWMHWVLLHTLGELPQSHEEHNSKRDLQRMSKITEKTATPEWVEELDELPWWIEPFEVEDSLPYPDWVIDFDYSEVEKAEDWMQYQGHRLLNNNPHGAYDKTVFVEKFVHHPTIETSFGTVGTYAGQGDLVYIDENGDTVMCDIKTSDEVHEAYYSQLMAYKKALEYHGYEIDRCEIVRADPVTQTTEVRKIPEQVEEIAWKRFVDSRQTVSRHCTFPDEPTDIEL
jgi:hypothetical protein